jgi:hypothetical protein
LQCDNIKDVRAMSDAAIVEVRGPSRRATLWRCDVERVR